MRKDFNYYYDLFKNESIESLEDLIFFNKMDDFMNFELDEALNVLLKEKLIDSVDDIVISDLIVHLSTDNDFKKLYNEHHHNLINFYDDIKSFIYSIDLANYLLDKTYLDISYLNLYYPEKQLVYIFNLDDLYLDFKGYIKGE